jgi:hypothetical protein
MKKTIIILAAIAIGIVLFLIGAYFVALNISKKEKPADSPNRVFTFLKNPTSPRYEDTASSTGNFVTITTTGTSTGTSTIQTLVTIPSSLVYENAESGNGNVVLAVESVAKAGDGTIVVTFKVLTYEATRTASIDPAELIRMTTPQGTETLARIVQGSDFRSIPRNSEVSGNLIFFPNANYSSIILQVGKEERVRFYEFDFLRKFYRLAPIS